MKLALSFLLNLTALIGFAQPPGGNRGGQSAQNMNMGRFYGKVVDTRTNKGVDAASIQLIQNKFDTVTKQRKDVIIAGELTRPNGNFNLENLPVMGQFKLRITAIGYGVYEQPVKFDMKMGGDMSQMMNNIDVDLGNIKLEIDARQLEEVRVVATTPLFQMGVDRRIFNVDKNIVTAGQTATELMRNVPGVAVDIDGNVTLRNAAPQIFIDGRPTTLTLDQIPADEIQSVELITNPSAKFDASGGAAGILNLILKKNRKAGYNGNLRAGIDSRLRFNLGGDINVKQDKVNIFGRAMINQRKSVGEGYATRQDFYTTPNLLFTQTNNPENKGFFGFGRLGMDYFMDIRNTFTISGTFVRGKFESTDELKTRTDSLYNTIVTDNYIRSTSSERNFRNLGAALGYKRLFMKKGMELTADFNFNSSRNDMSSFYDTQYYDEIANPKGTPILQKQQGNGNSKFYTFQVDYVNPLGEKSKVEAGLRGTIRDVRNDNLNYVYDDFTGEYVPIVQIDAKYKYLDKVFAGYGTYSNMIGKSFSYQAGLRIENSKYDGTLLTNDSSFSNSYPFSIFPSVFLTQRFENNQDVQLSYSRRINRPNFFQILPFIDFSDSLNVSVGNPGLTPEFTNSMELSYQKTFKGGHSLLFSAYLKLTDDLITRYQIKDSTTLPGKSFILNTYVNANSSRSYGLEITSKNQLAKWFDITTNLNFYNSRIDGGNLDQDLSNERWSFFGKISNNFKLPKDLSIQLSGDYRSRTILPQGGGGSGGGGRGFGFTQTTSQGYINPNYGVDIAIRKEFMKEKRASLTLSLNDIFKTRKYDIHSESEFFVQDSWRRMDWRVFRLNFTYRFGKFNVSLFKRKNTRSGEEGVNEGMQMQN